MSETYFILEGKYKLQRILLSTPAVAEPWLGQLVASVTVFV